MERRRGRRLAIVLAAVFAAGCGSGGDDPEPAAPVTATNVPWDTATATFATVPSPPGSGEEPMGPVPVQSIVWTDDGYRASGADGSRVAVWGSDDAKDWELISNLSRECCDRYEQAASLSRQGDRLLLLSTGGRRPAGGAGTVPAAFLRSSDDGGATWVEHQTGPFALDGTSVDAIDVTEGSVLVTARVEGNEYEVTNSLWRSTDLETWTELALPGAPEIGFRSIMRTPDDTLVAVATDWETGEQHWYRSTNDGASFEAVAAPSPRASWAVGPVGTRLLVMVEPTYDEDHADDVQTGPVLLATVDGRRWEPIERNTGLWGDGVSEARTIAGTGDLRYLVLERTIREDDRYCFDDVATCEQRERVLLEVEADLSFRRVAVELEAAASSVVAGDDGSLLLWGEAWAEDAPPSIVVQRWAGPDAPPADGEAAPLDPPTDLSPVLGWEVSSVEVGSTFRARLSLGDCGGGVLQAGDRQFINAEPPTEPYPDGWPVQSVDIDDGPSGYLFATGEHADEDTFSFEIDDDTTLVYRFDHNPPEGPGCG